MDASALIEWVSRFGFEYFQYYPSIYRAMVVRVDDPQERGRVQLRCPQVGHIDAPNVWVPPAFSGAGTNRGQFWPPEVGDTVYVCFQQGNAGRPQCYFGGWYGHVDNASEAPEEFAYTNGVPQTRGLVTRGGHRLIFKDTPDGEQIELVWHKPGSPLEAPVTNRRLSDPAEGAETPDRSGDTASLKFLPNGNIEVQDKVEQKITLDAEGSQIVIEDVNGNIVTLDSKGVTVTSKAIQLGEDADTEAMRHTEWEEWAKNHTHNTAWGPSDVPILPPLPSIKSKKVTLE
jgi:hypothetical protein